jgi:hypothetical protein
MRPPALKLLWLVARKSKTKIIMWVKRAVHHILTHATKDCFVEICKRTRRFMCRVGFLYPFWLLRNVRRRLSTLYSVHSVVLGQCRVAARKNNAALGYISVLSKDSRME